MIRTNRAIGVGVSLVGVKETRTAKLGTMLVSGGMRTSYPSARMACPSVPFARAGADAVTFRFRASDDCAKALGFALRIDGGCKGV